MDRRKKIQQRKKKKKQKSKPLTPIYFCDAKDCLGITPHELRKFCPVCKCFFYCSKECQTAHWPIHKQMCGKNPTLQMQEKLALYEQARDAAETLYESVKDGNYITVIHEKGEVPAAIFSTLATKSNVLNWKQYTKDPLFTTSAYKGFGSLEKKIRSANDNYPNHKLYCLSVIFDRLVEGTNNEAVMRLFIADAHGETIDAPNGKVVKQSVRYKRK